MVLPKSYTISKFKSFVHGIEQTGTYLRGACPICHEGKSGKNKKRIYYFIYDDYIYCHNCSISWSPYFWILEVSGMSFKEIRDDVKDYSGEEIGYDEIILSDHKNEKQLYEIPQLPADCINLKDDTQLKYYHKESIVKLALNYCQKRRLFSAEFAPKTYYVCINDYFHKNRLIIPYYGLDNKLESYISRDLLGKDSKPKYLIKFNSEKPIFNIDKIDPSYLYIFIFEGAIDAMFVKNGVAISGTSLTDYQYKQIKSTFPFHKMIWCMDNYKMEKEEVRNKIQKKIKEGELVFLYLNEYESYKDINDYCVAKKMDSVSTESILQNTFSDLTALMRLH